MPENRVFDDIARRLSGAMPASAQAVQGDLETARDVVQDAFLRLCRQPRARGDADLGYSVVSTLALRAWEQTKATLHRLGVCYAGMIMHHDRGSAFISYGWTSQLLLQDQVRLSYALRGAKDNPEMESFNGHFKNESLSLFLDARTIGDLVADAGDRVEGVHGALRDHADLP